MTNPANSIVAFTLPKRFVLTKPKWSWEIPLNQNSKALFNENLVVVNSVTKVPDIAGCQQIQVRLTPLEETGWPNNPYRLSYNKTFVARVPPVGKVLDKVQSLKTQKPWLGKSPMGYLKVRHLK